MEQVWMCGWPGGWVGWACGPAGDGPCSAKTACVDVWMCLGTRLGMGEGGGRARAGGEFTMQVLGCGLAGAGRMAGLGVRTALGTLRKQLRCAPYILNHVQTTQACAPKPDF
eukprot:350023-Chlamydomonas_euryale.AAC.1